jgi:GR25 family glycosyltransferase involved in LPS biosynthesis
MNVSNILLFALIFFKMAYLGADIEQHFRKVENKRGCHSMRNIDFIYMINLDQRPEKWKESIERLHPFGIIPCRFSAINGWELSAEAINDLGLKFSPEMEGGFMGTCYPLNNNLQPSHEIIQNYGQTYFCHCMARGAIGCVLSHLSILQDAYDCEYETIWIMEDDIELLSDPRKLPDLIDELDKLVGKGNWDVLFTDRDTRHTDGNYSITYCPTRRPDFSGTNNYAMKEEISSDFRQIGARYGSYSMILRQSGIRKLLQFFKAHQIFLPYDLEYILPQGIKLFTVTQNVVASLPKAPSDNGVPTYLNTLK